MDGREGKETRDGTEVITMSSVKTGLKLSLAPTLHYNKFTRHSCVVKKVDPVGTSLSSTYLRRGYFYPAVACCLPVATLHSTTIAIPLAAYILNILVLVPIGTHSVRSSQWQTVPLTLTVTRTLLLHVPYTVFLLLLIGIGRHSS